MLSFGEILWDVYPDAKYLGGAPLNLAAHASLQGAEAFMLSAVGRDSYGNDLINEVNSLGVSTKYISKILQKQTGKCLVTLDENALPSYNLLKDVSYDYIKLPDKFEEEFDVLAFGTLALRSEHNINVLKQLILQNNFKEIYTDLNIRPPFYSKASIEFCLKNATIVKISDEELPVVTDELFNTTIDNKEALQKLASEYKQVKIIILTLGKDGSLALDCSKNQFYYADAVPCNVVSTVGAGDSFGSTFLTSFFNGSDIQTSLELSSKISSYVVSKKDAVPSDMLDFLKNI